MAAHKGWLFLEAQKKPNSWSLRYFVLDEGYLRYFYQDDDLDPIATINVHGIEAAAVSKARVGKHAFRLNVTRQADGRYKYVCAGETESVSRQWLSWLAEAGVSGNASIKLTAKPSKEGGGLVSFLSFKPSKKPPELGAKSKSGSKLMGFLSFGGKKKPKSQKDEDDEPPVAGSSERSATSSERLAEEELPPPPVLGRLASSLSSSLSGPERSLLMPRSSVEALVQDGQLDGDAPFNEVMSSMSRASFVERSRTLSLVDMQRRKSLLSRRESATSPPGSPASTKAPLLNELDEDEPSDDEVDDQPEGAVPSEAEAEADGTGGVVLVTGDGGSAADAASSPMRPSEMPSFTSLIGSSLEIGAPASDAAVDISEPTYGSNYDEPAARPANITAEPPLAPTATAPAPSPSLMGSLRSLSSRLSSALAPPSSAEDELDVDAFAAAVASRVVGDAIASVEADAAPRRPSLLARLSAAFQPSKEAAEPPPPPPAVVEDSAEEAAVRAWIRQVLLAADEPATLSLLSDRTIGLREHLRSGVVLCAVLNALKPGAVGKVKAPSGTASRFARLEPLNQYRAACASSFGLADADALDPAGWLDGQTMTPLIEHLGQLCRRLPAGSPKLALADEQKRRAPTRSSLAMARPSASGGPTPFSSARDVMKLKGTEHVATRSVAGKGNSAWRGAKTNALAAKAVFEIEKGVKSGATETAEAKGSGAKVTVRSATGATHSFAESETIAFSEYINETLGDDGSVSHLLPLDVESMQLFDALRDGVILCKLINAAAADTIDMRVVHLGDQRPLSVYEVVENLNMAINAAVAIGCRVVNIGHDDVMSGAPHLVLGLLWQIVKAGIMAKINLKASPELIALLPESEQSDKEALRALLAMPPEKVLLKWLNFQVQRVAPGAKQVSNFGPALKDCTVYAQLLHAVAPEARKAEMAELHSSVLRTDDPLARATLIVNAAADLGVSQFKIFAADITKGNEKLNMGFTAAIFNHLPGLVAPAEHGTFSASLAHPSAIIREGGHAVLMREPGCALFGVPIMPKSGVHWVELRVLEASSAACYLGLAPEKCDKSRPPGVVTGSLGLSAAGDVLVGGQQVHCEPSSCSWAMGDLVRLEYDSDAGVITWTRNGEPLPYAHNGVGGRGAIGADGLLFGVGQSEGVLEVRIEGSSFTGKKPLALVQEDEGDSREERAFAMWINSLGLDTHVSDLPSQVRDGLLLLQLMDVIKPGVVDWSRATLKPRNVHAKVINCNYAVELGKKAFGFSLVGISGKDIQDGITKLVLALTWQLMRFHVIQFLSSLSQKRLSEKDVVAWANGKVAPTIEPISKLSDAALGSGLYVLHLLKAVKPRAVDMSQVTPGVTAEERKLNARLAVSCARKAGCMVFLLWEDIVECKPKMLLVLFATLMQLEMSATDSPSMPSTRQISDVV